MELTETQRAAMSDFKAGKTSRCYYNGELATVTRYNTRTLKALKALGLIEGEIHPRGVVVGFRVLV